MTTAERAARREADLESVVIPCVRAMFEKHSSLRSALFAVAQYWSDNANDEVHGHILFSNDEVPRWPHECTERSSAPRTERSPDQCTSCIGLAQYFTLPYDEDTFRAWEAYCHDHGNQEADLGDSFLPYALLRRGEGSAVTIEVMGDRPRPWLDAPAEAYEPIDSGPMSDPLAMVHTDPDDVDARRVLADMLLERADPRGEYLAIVLARDPSPEARARADELFAAHGRRWLGPLARVVGLGAAHFVNGFPERVAAYFPDDEDLSDVARAAEWATVRSLTFLPRSRQHLGPHMRNLRRLGPLDTEGLPELGESTAWAIEELHLTSRSNDGEVLELAHDGPFLDPLPRLSTLLLSGYAAAPDRLFALLRSPLARRLAAIHVALRRGSDYPSPLFHPVDVECWLGAARGTSPELALGAVAPAGERAGPWLHLRRRPDGGVDSWVEIAGLGSPCGFEQMCAAIAALPVGLRRVLATVAIRPTRWFTPTNHDVAKLNDAARS